MKKKKSFKGQRLPIEKPLDESPLITVAILSDLPGHRMKSYGPTSLINIKGKYLIDIQIDSIKKAFKNFEIILCLGFESEKICKYIRSKYSNINIRFVENQLFNTSNSCESVRLSLNNTLNDKILILDGNILISKKSLSAVDINQTCALIEKYPNENLEIGANINHDNLAQHFSFGAYRTWSEVLFLKGFDVIECARKFMSHQDNKKKFIFEAINDIIKHGHSIRCIENKFPIYKINNVKTYHNVKEHYEIFNF